MGKGKFMAKRIFEKYEGNPIVSPKDMPEESWYTFNPGAIKFNGEYLLMMDVTKPDDKIQFWIARSKNGRKFIPDSKPVDWPLLENGTKEMTVYDPRITKIDDNYYILYASHENGLDARIGIVKTCDFKEFERISIGSELGNRNGVLFPEKINGLYCRLDRPFGDEKRACGIWASYSPDLVFWGKSRPLTKDGQYFHNGAKIGAGAVPIRTDNGWLEIYHHVAPTMNGFIYRLRAMMLDFDDPSVVIGDSKDFILWPEHDYEMKGRVGNVVFTCNAILEDDGTLKVYYGAADTHIGLAEARLSDIIDNIQF